MPTTETQRYSISVSLCLCGFSSRQNLSAPLTCNVRPAAADVTVPNACDDKRFVFGFAQRTKLNGFVASTLKSKFRPSRILNSLPTVSASCLPQNPRTQLKVGARFPKLKPVEVVKASGFRNLILRRIKISRVGHFVRGNTGDCIAALRIAHGAQIPCAPDNAERHTELYLRNPFTLQPETTAFKTRESEFSNRLPFPKGSSYAQLTL